MATTIWMLWKCLLTPFCRSMATSDGLWRFNNTMFGQIHPKTSWAFYLFLLSCSLFAVRCSLSPCPCRAVRRVTNVFNFEYKEIKWQNVCVNDEREDVWGAPVRKETQRIMDHHVNDDNNDDDEHIFWWNSNTHTSRECMSSQTLASNKYFVEQIIKVISIVSASSLVPLHTQHEPNCLLFSVLRCLEASSFLTRYHPNRMELHEWQWHARARVCVCSH